ncbi:type IV secretion system protein [Vibrio sp. SS-MA-C1-2]|uniref:virB8 family protein n=1 Tax=Vibrio sp. SS-MA-C1-2 TaxID=2908646 RepID=UPI001F35A6E0|nr:type IV secretion system protein [Vibrio sp. SS-MA-C1-2]UJF17250.1 type IV secretion system protein [Vibrio sp. SS-MA-C1-2]
MEESLEKVLALNKQDAQKPNHKKNTKKVVDAYLSQIKAFESDRVEIAKKSAKTAWKLVSVFAVLASLAVAAVIMMMPLKQIEPYLLKVDATGYTEVVRPLSDANSVTYGEVLDKYWLRRFITERNSYEWETVQNSFNTVKLMSAQHVFAQYSNYIMSDTSPTEIFAENNNIHIVIDGITFLPKTSNEQTLAQIRFSRKIVNRDNSPALNYVDKRWMATVTFDYLATINTEDERHINPLGFRITSYREDEILD